jgi:hypothetical protein
MHSTKASLQLDCVRSGCRFSTRSDPKVFFFGKVTYIYAAAWELGEYVLVHPLACKLAWLF